MFSLWPFGGEAEFPFADPDEDSGTAEAFGGYDAAPDPDPEPELEPELGLDPGLEP